MKKQEILSALEGRSYDLKEFGVVKIGLFGSHARGDETPSSDLDFIVEFETKTFDAYMDCKNYLETLFGRPVDLVMVDSIKPRLRPIILKETVYVSGL
jgi:hypothetical protein